MARNNGSIYHHGIQDDVEVVLYVPKSQGVIVATHESVYKLSALEGVSNSNILAAIGRKGTYYSQYHKRQVAPRYKRKEVKNDGSKAPTVQ